MSCTGLFIRVTQRQIRLDTHRNTFHFHSKRQTIELFPVSISLFLVLLEEISPKSCEDLAVFTQLVTQR